MNHYDYVLFLFIFELKFDIFKLIPIEQISKESQKDPVTFHKESNGLFFVRLQCQMLDGYFNELKKNSQSKNIL